MRFEIKFNDKDPLSVFLKPLTSFTEFQNTIIRKLGLQGIKRVDKLFYRISIFVVRDDVKYDSFAIGSYEDLQVLFHYCWQFPEVRTPKLLAKLVDVVSSSGGSNHNPQPSATAACSSSRDENDDDVEPATIADDSDDELATSTPAEGGAAASSETPQYPLALFNLGLGCHETAGGTWRACRIWDHRHTGYRRSS
ncbi:hypothetical protein Ahy_B09g098008 isoform A [Arachis hypogaea]|uniref:Uncharacterized protein n=1 Tax=Arachis hypogaea TaxID=3818 RepID=A0A444XQG6_ARAHY|nr:hypothetical protein Ahy_B09g098008 isoform A [Arachis hypogaea]